MRLPQDLFRTPEMLQHVQQQNPVEALPLQLANYGADASFEVSAEVSFESSGFHGTQTVVYAGDPISVGGQLGRKEAFSGANIQHIVIRPHHPARVSMTGRAAMFDGVMNEVFLKFRETAHGTASLLVPAHGTRNVAGVAHPVDVTYLVAVIGGDGNLVDPV